MNFFKLIFILLFIWCSIYTVSVAVYNFKRHYILTGVNAVLLEITSIVLCLLYVI